MCAREVNLSSCESLTDGALETLAMYQAGQPDVDPYSSLSDIDDEEQLLAALTLSAADVPAPRQVRPGLQYCSPAHVVGGLPACHTLLRRMHIS